MPKPGSLRIYSILLSFALLAGGCAPEAPKDKAPDFILPSLDGQKTFRLSEIYPHSAVLLIFWASWCPGCMEEIPALNKLHETALKTGNLKILAVNVEESREEVARVQNENGIRYPILLDEEGAATNRFGIVGLPSAILIAKGGKIIYYGFTLPEHLEERIQQGEFANEP